MIQGITLDFQNELNASKHFSMQSQEAMWNHSSFLVESLKIG